VGGIGGKMYVNIPVGYQVAVLDDGEKIELVYGKRKEFTNSAVDTPGADVWARPAPNGSAYYGFYETKDPVEALSKILKMLKEVYWKKQHGTPK
jgi:hypothetical protein